MFAALARLRELLADRLRRRTMEQPEVHALTAAYALDALDEAEEREYEAHLAAASAAARSWRAHRRRGARSRTRSTRRRRRRCASGSSSGARASGRTSSRSGPPRVLARDALGAVAAVRARARGRALGNRSPTGSTRRDEREVLADPERSRGRPPAPTGRLVVTRDGEAVLVVGGLERAPPTRTTRSG